MSVTENFWRITTRITYFELHHTCDALNFGHRSVLPLAWKRLGEPRALATAARRRMARYFFDITDGKGFHRDDFGDEFDSVEQARDQAQALLPDIARAKMPGGELLVITCDLRDETRRIVYRSTLTLKGTLAT